MDKAMMGVAVAALAGSAQSMTRGFDEDAPGTLPANGTADVTACGEPDAR